MLLPIPEVIIMNLRGALFKHDIALVWGIIYDNRQIAFTGMNSIHSSLFCHYENEWLPLQLI